MSEFSTSSIKNKYNNAVGSLKDLGGAVIGRPGAAKSFTHRAYNSMSGMYYGAAQPFRFISTMDSRTPEQNAYGIGYLGFQLGVIYFTSRFFESISKGSVVSSSEFESLYRVQGGGSKMRFVISPNEISIVGSDMLFVNIGQETRAMTFLAKRGEDAVLLKIKIDPKFVEKIRSDAVNQNVGRLFPGRPQIVDANKAPDQYGIPKEYFSELLKSINPKSIEIIRKQ